MHWIWGEFGNQKRRLDHSKREGSKIGVNCIAWAWQFDSSDIWYYLMVIYLSIFKPLVRHLSTGLEWALLLADARGRKDHRCMMKLAMVGISQETIIVMQIDAVMLNSPAGGGATGFYFLWQHPSHIRCAVSLKQDRTVVGHWAWRHIIYIHVRRVVTSNDIIQATIQKTNTMNEKE